MTAPKVYVVVLNWNGAADTCACVDSLLQLAYPNLELVICDNASRVDSLEDIRAWARTVKSDADDGSNYQELNASELSEAKLRLTSPATVTLIHTGGNLGYAGGMNVGIRYAQCRMDMDFVWILNNDTVVDTMALTELVCRIDGNPTIGICGSTLINFDNRSKVQAFGGAAYEPWRGRSKAIGAFADTAAIPADPAVTERDMAYVIGASMLVNRRFIDEVGLMDEAYFLYSEEQDWAFRGRTRAFTLGYAAKSFVFHKHGATIGTAPAGGSTLSLFYLYRAKLMFTRRHYPLLLPSVLLSLAWEGFKFLLKGKPSKAKAVGRGLVAAFTGRDPN